MMKALTFISCKDGFIEAICMCGKLIKYHTTTSYQCDCGALWEVGLDKVSPTVELIIQPG